MKFLPEFALCFGGATITPTVTEADTTAATPSCEEQNRRGNSGEATTPSAMRGRGTRRVVKFKNGANWKPALRAIAEERAMSDVVVDGNGARRKERAAVPSTCVKSVAKVKAKSIARSKLTPRHGDDYWYVLEIKIEEERL
ncbi:hypothetical protein RND71_013232 [Anisodus tanguticus]|uniref:Uncharacterized protein n=1 Tax=Anisodus tanguticus TaxID=243964 RepID=A0AAE1SGQ0_9SOLA|nr:hypothetical protein RND71_013232 [Anisodus tanguticus]